MGNVGLFPAGVAPPPPPHPGTIPLPVLTQAVKEPRVYSCLDPLPEYFQADQDYFEKLADAEGRLVRSVFKPSPEPEPQPEPEEDQEEIGFSMEAIRRKRILKGKLEYLVQWEDCPEEANTWEPEEHLKKFPWLIIEFERIFREEQLKMKRKNAPPPGPGRGWNSRRRAARTAREAKRRKREEQLEALVPQVLRAY